MENYEKKYKEAIERAKLILSGEGVPALPDMNTIEAIFPELAESEDEKIRKAINDVIHLDNNEIRSILDLHNISYQDAWDWLEKKGEHNNFIDKIQVGDQVTRNEDGVLVNLSQLKRIAKLIEKQGEQKHIPMIQWTGDNLQEVIRLTGLSSNFHKWFKSWKDYEDYVNSHNNIFKLFNEDGSYYEVPVGAWIIKTPDGHNVASNFNFIQKSEWSEEDETHRHWILEMLKAGEIKTPEFADHFRSAFNWLKSLKDRVMPQPKQEWSEEDESFLVTIIHELQNNKNEAKSYEHKTYDKLIDWLKSLRPQNKNEMNKQLEDTIREIKTYIAQCNGFNRKHREEVFSLLDTLRPQNRWVYVDSEIYTEEPVLAQRIDKSSPNKGYVICYDHTLTPDTYERYIKLCDIGPQNHWKPSEEQMASIR